MNARRIHTTLAAAVLALLLAASGPALALDTLDTSQPEVVRLSVGRSLLLNLDRDVARVALAAPDLADVMVLSPRQLYLSGKAAGSTNLMLWDGAGNVFAAYDVVVGPDITALKRLLHETLPEERGLRVMAAGGKITLSGTVSSTEVLGTVLSLAEAHAPDQVVNLLSVGGAHQVMVEVRVAEMSRSLMQRLGFNFAFANGDQVVYSFLDGLTSLDDDGLIAMSSSVNAAFGVSAAAGTLSGFLDALRENGLVRVLAEPNLVCLSGQGASFLAGGEIPIPVPGSLGTTAIEYKPFGVGLTLTPTVLSDGRINLQVNPEVSELDYTRSVTIAAATVPAVSTRRASTTVELADGQSFAIAGLISDSLRESSARFPVLGDLPVIGSLFRSSEFQRNETELVIIVTPHLARPIDMAGRPLPTDSYVEPTEFEFFMLGQMEGDRGETVAQSQAPLPSSVHDGGFDGQFGHSMP